MQLPMTLLRASMAWFQAANAGTSSYPFLTAANASLLVTHGSEAQIEKFVPAMLEGRFFGTMCLSEPQAGSSLADITTKAVPAADGTYRITGTKMWISGGDHELTENIVHLVLAKIPGGPAGVKGISLFIVPKFLVDDDGTLATATMLRWWVSTTRWATVAPPTPCSTSVKVPLRRAGKRALSVTSSANPTRACGTCST